MSVKLEDVASRAYEMAIDRITELEQQLADKNALINNAIEGCKHGCPVLTERDKLLDECEKALASAGFSIGYRNVDQETAKVLLTKLQERER